MADSLVLELNNRQAVCKLNLFFTLLFQMKWLKNFRLRIWPVWLYCYHNNNNNNNIYLLQLGCYPVAVVILYVYKT